MTRWNLSIPEETYRAVRAFLKRNRENIGNLSDLVNDAVRRRIMELTISNAKDRNARFDQCEILEIIDEEVDVGREGRA